MRLLFFSLQADQLTEEQIAGKTSPPTPVHLHMAGGVDSVVLPPSPPPSLRGFILFPFMASLETRSGHIPRMNGQVVVVGSL